MKDVVLDYGKKFLVVGDLMLDVFIRGTARRLSPEAPIPVVNLESTVCMPGGAANVASNLVSLGCAVDVLGFVGDDVSGRLLLGELGKRGIGTDFVNYSSSPTTVKTRVIASNQHVVRIDEEERVRGVFLSIPDFSRYDGVIVSDYAKGVLTECLVRDVCCVPRGYFVAVDPKPQNFGWYGLADLVTPNELEAECIAGVDLNVVLSDVRRYFSQRYVTITRGSRGTVLFDGENVYGVPTRNIEVKDVSGAGDTFIAALVASFVSGNGMLESAYFAQAAAEVVIQKSGTAVATLEEVKKWLSSKGG